MKHRLMMTIALLIGLSGPTVMNGAAAQNAQPDAKPVLTYSPTTMFLTWQGDPTTTMTVQWLGDDNVEGPPRLSVANVNGDNWRQVSGERVPFPYSQLYVHRIEIKNLKPGTVYRFRFQDGGEVHHFQTMPAKQPDTLKMAFGGDAGASTANVNVCKQAARQRVNFAVIGGDIAYANGTDVGAWVRFLKQWNETMVAIDDESGIRWIIPMVVTIGNHEVQGGFQKTRKEAPLFYALYGMFKDRGYEALDFGDYMSLILLDSDHSTPYEGPQTEWLKSALEARKDVPHVFPVYHQPAYPSHRPYDGRRRQLCRELWVPLFEQYKVAAVFENDDHTYKRSVRIREGKQDPNGILYLGDGCWGRGPRPVMAADETWYLEKSASANHFILVTLTKSKRTFTAIDQQGSVIDSVEEKLK